MKFFRVIRTLAQNNIVRLGFSVLILGIVFSRINIHDTLARISRVPISVFLVYLGLTLLTFVLSAWRWMLWLYPLRQFRQFPTFLRATMLGLFYNIFLPSTVGGDAVKWTTLLDRGFTKKRLILSVIQDRVSGVMGIIFIGLACLGWNYWQNTEQLPVVITVVLCILAVVLLGYLLSPAICRWLLQRSLTKRLIFLERLFTSALATYETIIGSLLISILIQSVAFYAIYLLANGLQLHISLFAQLLYGSIVSLLLILPISFSGFGLTDAGYLGFFAPLGVPREGIIALTSLLNVTKILLAGIGWGYDFIARIILAAGRARRLKVETSENK